MDFRWNTLSQRTKYNALYFLLGLLSICVLIYLIKKTNTNFEPFADKPTGSFTDEEELYKLYKPVQLNLFLMGFAQFYSDDSTLREVIASGNVTEAINKVSENVMFIMNNCLFLCNMIAEKDRASNSETLAKSQCICDLIDLESMSANNNSVPLYQPGPNTMFVRIFGERGTDEYMFAKKTLYFNQCLPYPDSSLKVSVLEEFPKNNQPRFLLNFVKHNITHFVLCRPMILYHSSYGIFRVNYGSYVPGSNYKNAMNEFYYENGVYSNYTIELEQLNIKAPEKFKTLPGYHAPLAHKVQQIDSKQAPIDKTDIFTAYYLALSSKVNYTKVANNRVKSLLLHIKREHILKMGTGKFTFDFADSSSTNNMFVLNKLSIEFTKGSNPKIIMNDVSPNLLPTSDIIDMSDTLVSPASSKCDIFVSIAKNMVTVMCLAFTNASSNQKTFTSKVYMIRHKIDPVLDVATETVSKQFDKNKELGLDVNPSLDQQTYSNTCIPNFEELAAKCGYRFI